MQHVPVSELVRSRFEQVPPDERRIGAEEGENVLELVAKTDPATRLLEGGAPEVARSHPLVGKPPVT